MKKHTLTDNLAHISPEPEIRNKAMENFFTKVTVKQCGPNNWYAYTEETPTETRLFLEQRCKSRD